MKDPRADPDDDEKLSSPRIDVVTVDRSDRVASQQPSGDALGNAALLLRRELAKLHQQAAAVERTIEDQRRERTDALDRIEVANARADEAEQRLVKAETEVHEWRRQREATLEELEQVRTERDNTARALEDAVEKVAELDRARAEIEALRTAQEEALRATSRVEAELTEIRARERSELEKGESERQTLLERFERTSAELASLREELTQLKAENARLRQESDDASAVASNRHGTLERERDEAREQSDRLAKSLEDARALEAQLATASGELTTLRAESETARSELSQVQRDLETASHDRDVFLDRALMAEREVEGVRSELSRAQRELDAAQATITATTARATSAERARASVEDSVKLLRDEVLTAFARWRSATPSAPPPTPYSAPPPTRAVPVSQELAREPSGAFTIDDDWTVGSQRPPAPSVPPKRPSVPAPSAVSGIGYVESPTLASVRAPNNTSVTAQPGAGTSIQPGAVIGPIPAPPAAPASAPPPASVAPATPPVNAASIPPAVYPSVPPASAPSAAPASAPPAAASASAPPAAASVSAPPAATASVAPDAPKHPSTPPPSSAPPATPSVSAASAPPPPPPPPSDPEPPPTPPAPVSERSLGLLAERDDLFERLGDPGTAREAAEGIRARPEWVRGRPPVELLIALTHLDYDLDHPVFELARSWERGPIARALVAALRDEPDPKLREHAAWLLKHLGSPATWPAIAELVSSDEEAAGVRRWLLEAVERLVASRAIGWSEVGDLVRKFLRNEDPSLRDAVVSVVASLGEADVKRRVLLDLLRTEVDEVVLSTAVHALESALPIQLDPAVAERLLGHPSPRVQRSVVEFIERSKRSHHA